MTQFSLSHRFTAVGAALLLLLASLVVISLPGAQAQEDPATNTFMLLNGDPTQPEFIAQGEDIFHYETAEVEFIPTVNFDNGVSVQVDVRDDGQFVERWHFNFAGYNEEPLVEGANYGATRFPFQEADSAGMSVTGDGRGCNESFGDFQVTELLITDGVVERFSADFVQSCDNGSALSGFIRVNSLLDPIPGFPIPPAPEPTPTPQPTPTPSPTPSPPPIDSTPPVATAELDQTGRIKGLSSDFIVAASCTDNEDGVQLASAEINGEPVADGQRVRLVISNRHKTNMRKGKLTVQASSIDLVVTCVDAAGNVGIATVSPIYG